MLTDMKRSTTAAVLFLLAMRAGAHDTWLVPEQFAVAPNAALALDLTSGMGFPALDAAVEPERVARAAYRLAGHATDIAELTAAEHSLRLRMTPADAGVAAIWVELQPRVIELEPDQVEEYLRDVGASDLVRQRWQASGQRWRERYTKHAKTFVRVGEAGPDRSWSQPVGMYLELVPQSDPTALTDGDDLTIEVLRDGSSLPGFAVGSVREGAASVGALQKSDAGGLVTVHLDGAGRWLLRGTLLHAAPGPDVDWESHFTTLTLDVRPR
jgi:uncharacterized GH25 family protein